MRKLIRCRARPCCATRKSQTGFSLVELALGMAVVAIMLGALLVPLRTQMEQRDRARTQATLEQIREALYGFAMINGRLPRPAVSETNGAENPEECGKIQGSQTPDPSAIATASPTESPKKNTNETQKACSGFVPWSTLGVPRTDAWGKLYMYSVSPRFSDNQPALNFADSGVWNIKTRLAGDPSQLTTLADKIVAVVFSFGAKNFGRSEHMTNIANSAAPENSPGNIDEIFNSGAEKGNHPTTHLVYRFRPPSTSENAAAGGQFDDQFVWIPTSLFMARMVEARKIP
jgi:type II secretory pathway pseudopilin PulG